VKAASKDDRFKSPLKALTGTSTPPRGRSRTTGGATRSRKTKVRTSSIDASGPRPQVEGCAAQWAVLPKLRNTSGARAEQDLAKVISVSSGRSEPAELSPVTTWTLPLDPVPDPEPSDCER
jgi:hypothetical protein